MFSRLKVLHLNSCLIMFCNEMGGSIDIDGDGLRCIIFLDGRVIGVSDYIIWTWLLMSDTSMSQSVQLLAL